MNKIILTLILLTLISCENPQLCADIIKGKPDVPLLNEQEYAMADGLFRMNNLNSENLLFYGINKDNLNYSHVKCYQYVNNLRVFTNDVIFHFDKSDHYYLLSGEVIPSIDFRTTAAMSKYEAIKMFFQNAAENKDLEKIKDGCLYCELGYYDLNAGMSNSSENFTLAWKIFPELSKFPYAYINDSDRSIIYYDDGIRY